MKKTLYAFVLAGLGLCLPLSSPSAQRPPISAQDSRFAPLATDTSTAAPAAPTQAPAVVTPAAPPKTNGLPARAATLVPPTAATAGAIAAPAAASTNAAETVASVASTLPRPLPTPPTNSILAPMSGTTITPSAAAANATPEEQVPPGMINLQKADVDQVLALYAEWANRTILRAANLGSPQITLKSQTALTRREAIQALDAILGINGIAMIPIGDKFIKAVLVAEAANAGEGFNKTSPDELSNLGPFITHAVQVRYVKPSELKPVLQGFAKNPNGILDIDATQMLVLRDYTENVKRMLEVVREVDVAVPEEYISEVIPIKYALASDIATALNSLSTGGSGTTVGSSTGRSAYHSTAGAMGGMGGVGGMGSPYGGMGSPYGGMGSPYGATPMGTTQPATTTGGTQPGVGSSFSDRLKRIISSASKATGEITVLGQTKIIADERTNSLLIYASRADMKVIKDIVSKLDVVLAQVLIEAVVMQVSLNDSANLGVSYLQRAIPNANANNFGVGAVNNNGFLNNSSFQNLAGAATNAAGTLPSGFSYLAHLGGDLDVSVQALASASNAKILQRPRIQTSHAVQATLFVGQQRPYPVSSYYGGGAYGGYASIQQLQIGVTIEVTPLINPEGLVVMDIHTRIDSFEGNVTIANVGDVPITSSKDAVAKVAVRDRDTIMLGGLIEDDRNSNNSGVPFLKDIPLLGYLFRSSSANKTRSELIVLLRPTVLPTPEVAALTASAEKSRMPDVRRLEREVQTDEAARLRAAEKELRSKP